MQHYFPPLLENLEDSLASARRRSGHLHAATEIDAPQGPGIPHIGHAEATACSNAGKAPDFGRSGMLRRLSGDWRYSRKGMGYGHDLSG